MSHSVNNTNHPTIVSDYFNNNHHGRLKDIVLQARRITTAADYLNTQLPEAIKPHYQIAHIKDHTLILQVSSAAWGMQLRHMIPSLIKKLNTMDANNLLDIKKIQYIIKPIAISYSYDK